MRMATLLPTLLALIPTFLPGFAWGAFVLEMAVPELGSKRVLFTERKPEGVLVGSCTGECQAVWASRRASLHRIARDGGANPGALACRELGGSVLTGQELDRSGTALGEQSACLFSDGSLVTTDSLHARAARNDRARGR